MSSTNNDFVFGRHAGIDFLKNQDSEKINKVFLAEGVQEDFAREVYRYAKKKHLIIQRVPKNKLDKLTGGENHQGLVLAVASFEYADFDQLLDKLDQEEAPLLLMLDNVEDPHNLGSILRSADATGVSGVIIPKRRASGLTPRADA